jgi:hypothetical protein
MHLSEAAHHVEFDLHYVRRAGSGFQRVPQLDIFRQPLPRVDELDFDVGTRFFESVNLGLEPW